MRYLSQLRMYNTVKRRTGSVTKLLYNHNNHHHEIGCTIINEWVFNRPKQTNTYGSSQLFLSTLSESNSQSIDSKKVLLVDKTNPTKIDGTTPTPTTSSIEKQYTRKTPLEHVLLRPGMYVGPNQPLPPSVYWVTESIPSPPKEELLNVAMLDPSKIQDWIEPTTTTPTKQSLRLIQRECVIVPALVKVFDEILVNASDNRLRHPGSCKRIDVIIDPGWDDNNNNVQRGGPFILIYNDGKGIPVHVHEEEQMYVPELVFGHLLTGSNFDDTEERVTGGLHGYGAKLTNIFSKSFTVETVDKSRRLKYKQTWNNNMTLSNPPVITKIKKGETITDYTCVSFFPDMNRLTGQTNDDNRTCISEADYAIMCRRVIDIAGCNAGKLHVTLNGHNITQSTFANFAELYRPSSVHDKESQYPLVCTTTNPRWKVGVGLSSNGSFESVSFVNCMSTNRGGTHVNVVTLQLIRHIQEHIEKVYTELVPFVSHQLIRRHLFVICDTIISNPTFDSQMKESLTVNPTNFGTSCMLSTSFLDSIVQSENKGGPGIIEEIVRVAKAKEQMELFKEFGTSKKNKRQLLSIPKLEDAHNAGTNEGYQCTLILTEGDSAKALAVAGLEVIGRKYYGVFPLRGKLLNVRDAPIRQLSKNVEIKALCSIIGLDFDKDYSTISERQELRYGHVMLMTDQDTDGSHIKGLVINFFRQFWPKLLQPPVDDDNKNKNDDDDDDDRPTSTTATKPSSLSSSSSSSSSSSFMSYFITPLLKTSKKGTKTITQSFYSMNEFNTWYNQISADEQKKWNIKYYKGLGTSTPTEAKEYFKQFQKHVRTFQHCTDVDGELLDMAFDKKRAADRREWILETYSSLSAIDSYHDDDDNNDKDTDMNVDNLTTLPTTNEITYQDFINKEMIHFSNADNVRSIPHVMDGLKPSQRKVLYACFKRKLTSEMKVAQLSGYCAEHTAYHHGEASLQSTIIGMAQDFVGANNINLLVPSGQFGTRLMGGTDAASPRYIFTYLNPLARLLFPEADDILLNYLEEDGQIVEPEYFCPIIPFLLVNGSQGIGTGWSTFIPPHNPKDLIHAIMTRLDTYQNTNDTTSTTNNTTNNNNRISDLFPYAKDFDGTIEVNNNNNTKNGSSNGNGSGGFVTYGKVTILNERTIHITELPLNMWTCKFKEHLLSMRDKSLITNFIENHTTTKVSFTVTMKPNQLHKIIKTTTTPAATTTTTNKTKNTTNNTTTSTSTEHALLNAFKLRTFLPTSNMYAFDTTNQLKKFHTSNDIIDEYFPLRMELYQHRKSVLESEMKYYSKLYRNRSRFIECIIQKQLTLIGGTTTNQQIINELMKLNFDSQSTLNSIRNDNTLMKKQLQMERNTATTTSSSSTTTNNTTTTTTNKKKTSSDRSNDNDSDKDDDGDDIRSEYQYLLGMPLSSLTSEKVIELQKDAKRREDELDKAKSLTAADLWRNDLEKLSNYLG